MSRRPAPTRSGLVYHFAAWHPRAAGHGTSQGSTGRADPETHVFADDGVFPNSRLPVLIYRGVLATPDAAAFEEMFEATAGPPRGGTVSTRCTTTTAPRTRCSASTGPRDRAPRRRRGTSVTLVAGDVVVIPAGVAHKNDGASADFRVVGAYPVGTSPDMQYGKPGERPGTDRNIARVGLPAGDPVRGGAHRRAVEGRSDSARVAQRQPKSLGSASA